MALSETLLESVSEFLEIFDDDDGFNKTLCDIIISGVSDLQMQGLKLAKDVKIENVPETEMGELFDHDKPELLGYVSEYIRLTTKLSFDTPMPATIKYMENRVAKLEYMIQVAVSEGEAE